MLPPEKLHEANTVQYNQHLTAKAEVTSAAVSLNRRGQHRLGVTSALQGPENAMDL